MSVDTSQKYFHETLLDHLSLNEVHKLVPPNSIVTKNDNDFPFGTTVKGVGVYIDPTINFVRVVDINGQAGTTEDWVFTNVKVVK